MQDFLSRSRPFFQDEGLAVLAERCIAMSGLGGVGGGAFLALVRCGCSRFRLAENGIFDPPDMNRQAGAFGGTMDRLKIDVYVELARSINPDVRIETWPEGLQPDNFEAFLTGADVYVGAIDAEKGAEVKVMTPALLERLRVPMFTAGVIGFGALMVNYHPGIMLDDAFADLVRAASPSAPDGVPPLLAGNFHAGAARTFARTLAQGPAPTTAIGGLLSNALLANEVLVHLLRGTGIFDREAVFAPRFVTVDALGLDMRVHDIRES